MTGAGGAEGIPVWPGLRGGKRQSCGVWAAAGTALNTAEATAGPVSSLQGQHPSLPTRQRVEVLDGRAALPEGGGGATGAQLGSRASACLSLCRQEASRELHEAADSGASEPPRGAGLASVDEIRRASD